ncbi:phosphoribosyltransferase [Rugosimonospora africana]|uniref:phosphoribosyltransferase n=1 Tax=Rugosimonospora africana TaxID=556532 RepID=UPI0019454B12|nr:phosphoribosyltransferase [Rugosimonospora africana]
MRYNEVNDHQTSLGGTTINAWETWARTRGAGSPPTFSSLLVLATAYGRGPLGITTEDISPSDLVSEAYERLAPEDQLSLKRYNDRRPNAAAGDLNTHLLVSRSPTTAIRKNIVGPDFNLGVPTIAYGNPEVCVFTLPNPQPGQLLNLTWETFGFGIERLIRQIKNMGRRLDADVCFGINEAGLVMATFLASAQFARCSIGYLRCHKVRDTVALAPESFYPDASPGSTILICDFEVKHADVIGFTCRELRRRYPDASLYFAVFGAMTKSADLAVASFDDLAGAQIMRTAELEAVFIAATMSPPGIEPPLELR